MDNPLMQESLRKTITFPVSDSTSRQTPFQQIRQRGSNNPPHILYASESRIQRGG